MNEWMNQLFDSLPILLADSRLVVRIIEMFPKFVRHSKNMDIFVTIATVVILTFWIEKHDLVKNLPQKSREVASFALCSTQHNEQKL